MLCCFTPAAPCCCCRVPRVWLQKGLPAVFEAEGLDEEDGHHGHH